MTYQEDPRSPVSHSRLKVIFTILFHSASAISVTIISKSALNEIQLPVTLLALQTLVQVILLTIVGKSLGWIQIQRPLPAWKAIAPLTFARLVGILAKTFCLANVNASFYQIARGLLLPFTLLLSRIFLHPRQSNPPLSLIGCMFVMLGFSSGLITDLGAMLTSTRGIVLGVGSSFTTAIESVVVKQFLGKRDEGMWQMVWMSNCMALVCYIPLLAASGESKIVMEMYSASSTLPQTATQFRTFLSTATATGCASFLLTIATFLQISITSPTTHMIVTAARGVAQSGLAVLILGEAITSGRVWSMACILGGSAFYAWGKDQFKNENVDGRGTYEKVEDPERSLDEKKLENDLNNRGPVELPDASRYHAIMRHFMR